MPFLRYNNLETPTPNRLKTAAFHPNAPYFGQKPRILINHAGDTFFQSNNFDNSPHHQFSFNASSCWWKQKVHSSSLHCCNTCVSPARSHRSVFFQHWDIFWAGFRASARMPNHLSYNFPEWKTSFSQKNPTGVFKSSRSKSSLEASLFYYLDVVAWPWRQHLSSLAQWESPVFQLSSEKHFP